MAKIDLSYKENSSGNFFVDSTCIDCGTCYWVAPETFKPFNGHSIVYNQPKNELGASYRALYSCPTNSIGVKNKDEIAKEVLRDFPFELAPKIYHTGFHSEKSFGAASYFIKRTEGNILIDSPRFIKKLADEFKNLGGVSLQLLTHQDDIADTDKYWDVFKGSRYIHQADTNNITKEYEILFTGNKEIKIAEDLIVIPVPGHTKGSVCFLYQNKYLFTGDHLSYSPRLNHLQAFKNACWYDYKELTKSVEKLLDYDFEYVLPGHGAPYQADKTEMKESLKKCITWMKA